MNQAVATVASSRQPPLSWPMVISLAVVHALALASLWNFSWEALGITLLLHWLFGGIGICLGYHRLLTHRSFQVPKLMAYGIAILGALALEGGPIAWVGWHRQHHAHCEDDVLDPYSARRGFWWSHMLWIVYPRDGMYSSQLYTKYASDLARDPFYRWLDRYYLWLQVPVGLALLALGGWSVFLMGVFLRIVLIWHSTWLVNSAAHLWGARPMETEDGARNNWWVALLTYGEGWHNHHHAYPRVAHAGWSWWEVDLTWLTIRLLEILGIAKNVVRRPL